MQPFLVERSVRNLNQSSSPPLLPSGERFKYCSFQDVTAKVDLHSEAMPLKMSRNRILLVIKLKLTKVSRSFYYKGSITIYAFPYVRQLKALVVFFGLCQPQE